ncbi:DUF4142 domain-containing protein [Mucilaginibacter sp. JRF]|uniref:DUF4142 domain-containing protein n=1 Tax=Mucilaginibacter sp. JRF TaxID=2780088 RepID=UPI001882314F|nr:DUF4142 domain-containing protein [Mucilaginibacter sp. JRF]MBE9584149.1 DUF4142 domain-containing protein [Mucilaginibacter sp. JRF]
MKKLSLVMMMALGAFTFQACQNQSGNKDAVETADSLNTSTDTSTSASDADSGTIADIDSKFSTEAANAGMTEIALSELATKKSTNADVKAFAAAMIKDHKAANEKLKALATVKNITLPAVVGEDEQKVAADLSAKAGAEFDKAYVDEMVKDHDKAVSLFEDASKNAKDADLKAFATETLPKLKAHQEHIKAIKDKLK